MLLAGRPDAGFYIMNTHGSGKCIFDIRTTVQLDANGTIEATDNTPRPSMLNLILRDKLGNSESNEFDSHKLIKRDIGKVGDKVLRTAELFYSSGAQHTISLEFTKQSDGAWNMIASIYRYGCNW